MRAHIADSGVCRPQLHRLANGVQNVLAQRNCARIIPSALHMLRLLFDIWLVVENEKRIVGTRKSAGHSGDYL